MLLPAVALWSLCGRVLVELLPETPLWLPLTAPEVVLEPVVVEVLLPVIAP